LHPSSNWRFPKISYLFPQSAELKRSQEDNKSATSAPLIQKLYPLLHNHFEEYGVEFWGTSEIVSLAKFFKQR